MNAKELIEAANEVLSSRDPACSHIWNAHRSCQWCHRDRRDVYVDELARHILATVRPDDDDPVTRERLESEPGWAKHPQYQWQFWHVSGAGVMVETASRWVLIDPRRQLKSMGRLRRLVAALGE